MVKCCSIVLYGLYQKSILSTPSATSVNGHRACQHMDHSLHKEVRWRKHSSGSLSVCVRVQVLMCAWICAVQENNNPTERTTRHLVHVNFVLVIESWCPRSPNRTLRSLTHHAGVLLFLKSIIFNSPSQSASVSEHPLDIPWKVVNLPLQHTCFKQEAGREKYVSPAYLQTRSCQTNNSSSQSCKTQKVRSNWHRGRNENLALTPNFLLNSGWTLLVLDGRYKTMSLSSRDEMSWLLLDWRNSWQYPSLCYVSHQSELLRYK